MAREAPIARIELGGEKRTLRYDLGAAIDLDEWTGINLLDPGTWGAPEGAAFPDQLNALNSQLRRPKVLAQFLTSLLRHEDEDLDWRTVARWIDLDAIEEILEVAVGVTNQGMPEPAEEDAGDGAQDGQGPPQREPVSA